jgi:hypothetical protein
MCVFFHKWEKWSEPKQESWVVIQSPYVGGEIYKRNKIRISQERICSKCGKYQIEYIDEDYRLL